MKIERSCRFCGSKINPDIKTCARCSEGVVGSVQRVVAPPIEGDEPVTMSRPVAPDVGARDEILCEDLRIKDDIAACSYHVIVRNAVKVVENLDLQGDFDDAAIIAALIDRSTERPAVANDELPKDSTTDFMSITIAIPWEEKTE